MKRIKLEVSGRIFDIEFHSSGEVSSILELGAALKNKKLKELVKKKAKQWYRKSK